MVPTSAVRQRLQQRGFRHLREWTHGVDTRLFAFASQATESPALGHLARPVSLYVGAVSHEKNIRAFLALDVPGSKVVCGTGPLEEGLRDQYPNVHWVGVLPRRELAHVYAACDVLVYPGRSESFGTVMLEAMACGVPVAAHPVDGPLQAVGESPAGALREDLHEAWSAALKVHRHEARRRALAFDWASVATVFVSNLARLPRPVRAVRPARSLKEATAVLALRRAEVSHNRHPFVE